MVRKINASEYLKRYDNMTATERTEYLDRVGEWLGGGGRLLPAKAEEPNARLQSVLQAGAGWNDEECRAFEEGAVLMSALVGIADTRLPDLLYAISAKRSIKRMFELLWETEASGGRKTKEDPVEGTGRATQDVAGKPAVQPGQEARKAGSFRGGAGDGRLAGGDKGGKAKVTPMPVRPKSIHQYVHLLPQKTQERAAQVKDLYRELDESRRKTELLMNDETASADDRAAWAKNTKKCDNTLRKIFDELDAEWAKLVQSGRVVVDDLGNARVVEVEGGEPADARQELSSAQKARRRELRKWLVDTRRGNGDTRDEHVAKWKASFAEYLTLEGDAAYGDEKLMAAAAHYGIEMEAKD